MNRIENCRAGSLIPPARAGAILFEAGSAGSTSSRQAIPPYMGKKSPFLLAHEAQT
jgi:hypothetical protein